MESEGLRFDSSWRHFSLSKIVVAALNVYVVEPETSNYDVLIRG